MTTRREASIQVWFDGQPMGDLLGRVHRLEIEERTDRATALQMVVAKAPDDDGDWDALADPRLKLLNRVTVAFQLGPRGEAPEVEAVVFDGYITRAEAHFHPDRVPGSTLTLLGLDASCVMHLDARQRAWPDPRPADPADPDRPPQSALTDGAIVRAIFNEYGFDTAQIEDTPVSRAPDRGVLQQRCTDAEFVRQIAQRHGYELYVERGDQPVTEGPRAMGEMVAHFHRPRVSAALQPALSLAPVEAPGLIQLTASWESHPPSRVLGATIDARTRRQHTLEQGETVLGTAMGPVTRARFQAERLGRILPRRVPPRDPDGPIDGPVAALAYQHIDAPHLAADSDALVQADHQHQDWFGRASGVVQGVRYPAIMRARRPLELEAAGPTLNGRWYVQMARHRWALNREGNTYEIDVELVRNALGEGV